MNPLPPTAHLSLLHDVLVAAATESGSAPAVTFLGDRTYSRNDLLEGSLRLAGFLVDSGVAPGDRVVLVLGNRVEFLISWFATSLCGAVTVPLNTALRGPQLRRVLDQTGSSAVVCDVDFQDAVEVALAEVTCSPRLVLVGGRSDDPMSFDQALALGPPISLDYAGQGGRRPQDVASIFYTSGTTGPSKGVMQSHRMCLAVTRVLDKIVEYRPDDVSFTAAPIFHVNALFLTFLTALYAGAQSVIAPRFSASRFWQQVYDSDVSVLSLVGNMAGVLAKNGPSPLERAHRVRLSFGPDDPEFNARFGINARRRLYGMTDVGNPIYLTPADAARAPLGTCGREADEFECKLVDDEEREVPVGTIGELILRPREPFTIGSGYWQMPEATVEAWRNLWFHTGDLLRRDEGGWFYFVDRKKDAIRRSGENISSYEVEAAIMALPGVAAVAAYAVPAEFGEDEVMVAVVRLEPAVTAADIIDICERSLPHFAVPRFIRFMTELPLTGTNKIEKIRLRTDGVGADTWDRHAVTPLEA